MCRTVYLTYFKESSDGTYRKFRKNRAFRIRETASTLPDGLSWQPSQPGRAGLYCCAYGEFMQNW